VKVVLWFLGLALFNGLFWLTGDGNLAEFNAFAAGMSLSAALYEGMKAVDA
jgi:hypothetical protein